MKLDRLRDEGLIIRFRRFRGSWKICTFCIRGIYFEDFGKNKWEMYIYYILNINFLLRTAQKYGCFVLHKHFDPNISSYFLNITNAWSNQRNWDQRDQREPKCWIGSGIFDHTRTSYLIRYEHFLLELLISFALVRPMSHSLAKRLVYLVCLNKYCDTFCVNPKSFCP